MARKVTAIPVSKPAAGKSLLPDLPTLRRVAGYARVSTNEEDQANSYQAQIDYYTGMINSRPDWQLVQIYTDEGISGTSTTRRAGFQQMVADALNGKIDLIVTKSVSRFARNTVDSLTTVRALKDKGVEIFFEKENIWTLDSKGELLITIMSSLAQEESRSISENVTWGHRKRFADGKVMMPFKHLHGFKRGPNGEILIDEEGAKIIRRIYQDYLSGLAIKEIAQGLEADGILTAFGKQKWSASTIRSILSNEKYKDDALLQKAFTVDFLTKKKKRNEGEVPQYYVTGSHEAIIDPEIWELTQARLAAQTPVSHSRPTSYEGLLICTFCGGLCGSKIWHSTSKYRSIRWQCNKKYQIQHPPKIPAVRTERLDEIWWDAYNQLVKKTKAIDFDLLIEVFADETKLADQLEALEAKRAGLEAEATALVDEASRQVVNVDKHRESYARLEFEHAKTIDEINQAKQTQASSVAVARLLKQMRRDGYKQPQTIDYRMVHVLTDRIEITATGEVTVVFKNGYRVQDSVK